VSIVHWQDARRREIELGHLRATWSFLGEAAGCVGIGVRRIEIEPGGWSTPAHEHGREEEIVYVLAGHGFSWLAGETFEIGAGDCIVYRAGRGAHTMHALEPLDVLAFGPRLDDESVGFPRLGFSLVGRRGVETVDGVVDGYPVQYVREAEAGPPELPPPSPRSQSIVNVADVEGDSREGPTVARRRRDLARAASSVQTGLKVYEVAPRKLATPPHCHSAEEEVFVVVDGEGFLLLGDDEHPVGRGHVVARPPGTGVAHAFRAGEPGLTFLAYGTREPNDIAFYPRSGKVFFRGVNLVARIESLDYWEGEE
jgi:uncharacterized cupin superfamily protein